MELFWGIIRFACLVVGIILFYLGRHATPHNTTQIVIGIILAAIGGVWIFAVDGDF